MVVVFIIILYASKSLHFVPQTMVTEGIFQAINEKPSNIISCTRVNVTQDVACWMIMASFINPYKGKAVFYKMMSSSWYYYSTEVLT